MFLFSLCLVQQLNDKQFYGQVLRDKTHPWLILFGKTEDNETTKVLSDWALKNTDYRSIFFNEYRGFDPIIAIAGRSTPEGPTFMIKNACFDVPHSMRIISYLLMNGNQLMAIKTYGIQYLIKYKNSTNPAFQNLDSLEHFMKVFEYNDFTIYKIVFS